MRLAVLFTGGKDSTYALYLAKKKGYKIVCLIVLKSKNPDSYMFHTSALDLVPQQADALSLPLLTKITSGEKEKELLDLKEAIVKAKKKYPFEGIVTGTLASIYQATRLQQICSQLSLWCFNPLWLRNPEEYWEELLRNNFKIIFTLVAADGFNENWLNTIIREREKEKLKQLKNRKGISLTGEGGEFESLVLDCPLFKKELKIIKAKKIRETPFRGRLLIEKVKLKKKNDFDY